MSSERSLAEAYLRNHRQGNHEDFWAYEQLDNLVMHDPETGWRVTRIALELTTTDDDLAYVAAGPLEDLLSKYGPRLIDLIEAAARQDERLQLALSGVWLRREDAVWDRWYGLMKDFGFAEGRRVAL